MAKCSSLIVLIWDVCSGYQLSWCCISPALLSYHLSIWVLSISPPISDYQQYHHIRQSHSHVPHWSPHLLISPFQRVYILSLFVLYQHQYGADNGMTGELSETLQATARPPHCLASLNIIEGFQWLKSYHHPIYCVRKINCPVMLGYI